MFNIIQKNRKPTIGSWIGILPMGNSAMMMGNLVLLDSEVSKVILELLKQNLSITAIHNHLVNETPAVKHILRNWSYKIKHSMQLLQPNAFAKSSHYANIAALSARSIFRSPVLANPSNTTQVYPTETIHFMGTNFDFNYIFLDYADRGADTAGKCDCEGCNCSGSYSSR